MFSAVDHDFMARALRLAQRGLFTTTPNPRVGCVIARDGKVIGEGWHQRAGEAHAEVAALRPFGWGSGLVARALIRLVLAQRGVDPEFLVAPEVGLRSVGRPAYVRAVRGYAEGTPEGVAAMLRLVAGAVERGAREPVTWLDDGPA